MRPVAAIWNLRAMRAEARRGRRAVAERRQRGGVRLPQRAVVAAALVLAGLASAFVAPRPLVDATTRRAGARAPVAARLRRNQVYLEVGASATAAGRVYQPITLVNLSGLRAHSSGGSARVGLSFTTASAELLGDVLGAAAERRRISTSASRSGRRAPTAGRSRAGGHLLDGRHHLAVERRPSSPTGTVSLLFPAASGVTGAGHAAGAGLFAAVSAAPAGRRDPGAPGMDPAYAVTGLSLSRAASAPLSS